MTAVLNLAKKLFPVLIFLALASCKREAITSQAKEETRAGKPTQPIPITPGLCNYNIDETVLLSAWTKIFEDEL